jgi:hypothetical protein
MHLSNAQRMLFLSMIVATLSACGGDGKGGAPGRDGANGGNGRDGADGASALVAIHDEPAGTNCASGGKRIDYGKDANGNAVLDPNEITGAQYVCNGSDGADDSSALIDVSPEPAGAKCPQGGNRVNYGVDSNGNGMLDTSEIAGTRYICNGETYTVSGEVTGLIGSVVLVLKQNDPNKADVFLTMAAPGQFTFGIPVNSGAGYTVAVHTQPADQTCTVTNESGTANAHVTNVQVTCTTNPLTLASSDPAADATDIERTVTPSMVFSQPLDETSVEPSDVTLSSAAGEHPVTLSVSGKKLTATPTRRLLPGTRYTLRASDLMSTLGGRLEAAEQRSFTTRDGKWQADELFHSSGSGGGVDARIAFDPSGNAVAAWQGSGGNVWVSRYIAGSWEAATSPGASIDGERPVAAIDAAGNILVVLSQNPDQIPGMRSFSARRYVNGSWEAPESLVPVGPRSAPEVAVSADGHAVIVWSLFESQASVWAIRFTPPNFWEPFERLSGTETALNPHVAVDAAGNVLVVWENETGGSQHIGANYYIAEQNAWRGHELIDESDEGEARLPKVAMNAQGNAMVVWQQKHPVYGRSIWAKPFTPGSGDGWGSAEVINQEPVEEFDPQVAVNANGDAVVVWRNQLGEIWARPFIQGEWGKPAPIGQGGYAPQIAVDPAGNALAVWRDERSSTGAIYAARFTVAHGWVGEMQISQTTGPQIGHPAVFIDNDGNGFAFWMQPDSGSFNAWASRFE